MGNKFNKIIAVDFDGTLCENAYPEIGKANTALIEEIEMEDVNHEIG